MSTAETRAAWADGRKEARARFKAEREAAGRGEVLPPVVNSSPAMLLYLGYLTERHAWQQRQAADPTASSASAASDSLASSVDGTQGLFVRSVNAVADMYWCIDNLNKIRADVGDSKHSDWSDYWEAGYKKTKPWGRTHLYLRGWSLAPTACGHRSTTRVLTFQMIETLRIFASPPNFLGACCTLFVPNTSPGMTTGSSRLSWTST